MPRRPVLLLQCIVCKRRKARYVNGCCEPCDALVQAEGTHEKFGVPKETAARRQQREKVAEYNKLIAARMTLKQIAALWNMDARRLSSYAYRWRRAGFEVALGWGNQIETAAKPKMANKTQRKIAEHGVGWGVKDCTCEPCKASARVLRAAANRNYRKRRKAKREAAAKLAAE